jgi:hypothetical protein
MRGRFPFRGSDVARGSTDAIATRHLAPHPITFCLVASCFVTRDGAPALHCRFVVAARAMYEPQLRILKQPSPGRITLLRNACNVL